LSGQALELEAWVRLLRGHAAITRLFNARLVAEHGLTINDYEVLLLLSHAEGGRLRRVDLAERVRLSPSGITRLLDGLERAGLVAKGTCPEDARVTYAVLTALGRTKLEAASESHLGAVRTLFADAYSEEELRTLSDLLSRLPDAADGDGAACRAGTG
jgi:DNA-binding MarR family transcriptional regulator